MAMETATRERPAASETPRPERPEGLFDSAWQKLGQAWREIARFSGGRAAKGGKPAALRAQIEACLEGQGGEVSARARAAGLARAYLGFPREERVALLRLLASEYAPPRHAVEEAMGVLRAAATPEQEEAAQRRLRLALEPRRLKLLRQFNALRSGPRFLVELRAELLDLAPEHPELKALEADLKELLASWFDIGFLELRSLTWDSPASLLEKLSRYEAVHRIRSWQDLKNRLDVDRRVYAFFHPSMPDEPLIFVEVALADGLAGQIQELLDPKAPALDPDEASAAIFYSISNTQRGLAGISFGSFLIKQVVDRLRHEQPGLKQYATLSPIPGFVPWLREALEAGDPDVALAPGESKRLEAAAPGAAPQETLRASLDDPARLRDPRLVMALKTPLLRLCARYLLKAKRPDGRRSRDPVAHFHLSNGARLQRLNWMADTSPKGLAQSAGIMINYLYQLERIERRHEAYASEGKIAASSAATGLAK